MSTFNEGFKKTSARDDLLRRVLSHNRGLEVTSQPKPKDLGRTAISPAVLINPVASTIPNAESLRARLAEQS